MDCSTLFSAPSLKVDCQAVFPLLTARHSVRASAARRHSSLLPPTSDPAGSLWLSSVWSSRRNRQKKTLQTIWRWLKMLKIKIPILATHPRIQPEIHTHISIYLYIYIYIYICVSVCVRVCIIVPHQNLLQKCLKEINNWAVSLVRYSGPFLNRTRKELRRLDHERRKLMMIHKAPRTKDDIQSVARKKKRKRSHWWVCGYNNSWIWIIPQTKKKYWL